MKKIITLLLAGLLLGTTVLFAACGTNNDESSTGRIGRRFERFPCGRLVRNGNVV